MGQIKQRKQAGGRAALARPTVPTSSPGGQQRQLPLPWGLARRQGEPRFAHPAEAEFARILTYYRIRWLYEPTSFVLSRGTDGRPTESFTPDFYLPDHRLFIELTTMRQALVTRKNRKLRRLRELYPGVQVRLLYRKDVHRLLGAYDRRRRETDRWQVGEPLFTEQQIAERVAGLAEEIAGWMRPDGDLAVVGLAPGALTFQHRLVDALRERGIDVAADQVAVTRFRSAASRGLVRLVCGPRRPFAGKDVLIVADVVSSGLSIAYLATWFRRHGARRVEVCAFFDRACARLIDLPVRFVGFEAPEEALVGCGLGLRAAHRLLPYVAALRPLERRERPEIGRATIAAHGDLRSRPANRIAPGRERSD